MAEALRLARRGQGHTSPNPAVGAVVVKKGRIIGRGYHKRAGLAHAEVVALKGLDRRELMGSVLYVTLEPCCHAGRTAPCTDAILASGIKKVVVGASDPNPLVSGKGIALLRANGLKVTEGVLAEEASTLNEWFEKFIITGLPYVRLKLAVSLDGRIASGTGESKWITGPLSRRYAHRLRAFADAVLVGSNTAVKDNPALTVRHVRGLNPVRVVLDSSFRTPLSAKLFQEISNGSIVFTTRKADKEKVQKARARGIKVFYMASDRSGGVDIKKVLKKLAECGIANILIEGGGLVAASVIKAGLVDRVSYFIAPIFLGSDAVPGIGTLDVKTPAEAPGLCNVRVRRLGCDVLVEGAMEGPRP